MIAPTVLPLCVSIDLSTNLSYEIVTQLLGFDLEKLTLPANDFSSVWALN
jgi:hypothetical protein